jgi:SAM-dependent methyltransferase
MTKPTTKRRKASTTVAPPLELAPSSLPVNLDFGCGEHPRDGFEGVDLHGTKAKHRVDLFKFPLPWADNSVDEIHASHFLEHLPAREVEIRDLNTDFAFEVSEKDVKAFFGKDFLFAFIDECYRVLKPDGWLHVIVPCGRSNRAFQDPTHRRFFVEDTFAYFWKGWRDVNVPQYPILCNFEAKVMTTTAPELGLRTPEVQGVMIKERWNVGIDIVAKLRAVK